MRHGDWLDLVRAFVDRRIDAQQFHDRFFAAWSRPSAAHVAEAPPAPVEKLFYVVEAYCPDPSLRDPGSPYEADEAELHEAAASALAELGGRLPR